MTASQDGLPRAYMTSHRLIVTPASEIEPEPVKWLWHGRIAYGKLNALVGDPGLGKSTVALDLAARLSTGRSMPGEKRERPPTPSLILSAEDSPGDTIIPRLEAAGANRDLIHLVTGEQWNAVQFPKDVEELEEKIRKTGARFVVIDPLMAFLGGNLDSHRDADVRQALAPLMKLAERTGTAIVFIAHLNKSEDKQALHRVGGSIGIVAAIRLGLLLGAYPKDPDRRVLAQLKTNLGKPVPSYALRLVDADEHEVARVQYDAKINCSAETLLRQRDSQATSKLDEAQNFLKLALADGPRPSNAVRAEAQEQGISDSTLTRARQDLGVVSKPGKKYQGRWYVMLPEDEDAFDRGEFDGEPPHPEEVPNSGGGNPHNPQNRGIEPDSTTTNDSDKEESTNMDHDEGDSKSPDRTGNNGPSGDSLGHDSGRGV